MTAFIYFLVSSRRCLLPQIQPVLRAEDIQPRADRRRGPLPGPGQRPEEESSPAPESRPGEGENPGGGSVDGERAGLLLPEGKQAVIQLTGHMFQYNTSVIPTNTFYVTVASH